MSPLHIVALRSSSATGADVGLQKLLAAGGFESNWDHLTDRRLEAQIVGNSGVMATRLTPLAWN